MTADPDAIEDAGESEAAVMPSMDERLRSFVDEARKRHMRRLPNLGVRVEKAERQG